MNIIVYTNSTDKTEKAMDINGAIVMHGNGIDDVIEGFFLGLEYFGEKLVVVELLINPYEELFTQLKFIDREVSTRIIIREGR